MTGAYALSPLREAVSTKKRQRFPEKTQRKTVRYPAHHLKELTARVTTGAYALSPLREAVNNYTSWDTILTVPLAPFYPIDFTRGSQRHTHELPNVPISHMIDEIYKTAQTYFLVKSDDSGLLRDTIIESIKVSDENYGINEAVKWANNYAFPEEMILNDIQRFEDAKWDFVEMVRQRLLTSGPHHLNAARAAGLSIDNPERHLVLELATEGMFVPIPNNFRPNGARHTAPLRASYVKVHQAVNRMLADNITNQLAFILPKTIAMQHILNIHLGTAHWSPKKGKPSAKVT
jgi:hypothetical protein